MTKKMIEKYVILDMNGNVVEEKEDVAVFSREKPPRVFDSHELKLRVYDRERMATIITMHSGDLDLDLYAAKACIASLDEYVPQEPEPEEEVVVGDENNSNQI